MSSKRRNGAAGPSEGFAPTPDPKRRKRNDVSLVLTRPLPRRHCSPSPRRPFMGTKCADTSDCTGIAPRQLGHHSRPDAALADCRIDFHLHHQHGSSNHLPRVGHALSGERNSGDHDRTRTEVDTTSQEVARQNRAQCRDALSGSPQSEGLSRLLSTYRHAHLSEHDRAASGRSSI